MRTNAESRGQMILIGALTMAVLIVGLALVLNSAIYTENLATRSEQTGVSNAVGYLQAVEDGGYRSLQYANENHHDSYADVEGSLGTQAELWAASTGAANTQNAQLTEVEVTSNRGTRIVQRNGGEFTPANTTILDRVVGNPVDPLDIAYRHWIVVDDAQVRNATMQVDRSGIDNTIASADVETYLADLTISVSQPAFTVAFQTTGGTSSPADYRVAIYRNSANEVALTVYNEATDTASSCTPVDADTVSVDITGQTFGGEHCEALSFVEDLPDQYELYYVNPEEISGNYSMVIDQEKSAFESEIDTFYDNIGVGWLLSTDNFHSHDHASSQGPTLEYAVYDAELTATYRTDAVTYQRTVRVAPGEP